MNGTTEHKKNMSRTDILRELIELRKKVDGAYQECEDAVRAADLKIISGRIAHIIQRV